MSPRGGAVAALAVGALGLGGCGGSSRPSPGRSQVPPVGVLRATVTPQSGGPHTVFRVAVPGDRRIGIWQHAVHGYRVRVLASRLRNGCIVDTDAFLHTRALAHDAVIVLDPSRIMGQQWCPGRFSATVSYYTAYACPAHGTCRPPARFASRSTVLGRLHFTVSG